MVRLFSIFLKTLPVIGLALIAVAVVRTLRSGVMDQASIVLTAFGFVLLLALFLKVEAASLRYYLNLGILSVLMLVVLLEVLILVRNHDPRWDLTRNARHSLAPQTVEILQNLRRPVEIQAIADANEPFASYLSLYAAASPMLTYKITNPYSEVALFDTPDRELRINDIWIRSEHDGKPRGHRIQFQGDGDLAALESEIVGGILQVVRERPVRLYFLTSHGEKTPRALPTDEGQSRTVSQFAEQLVQRAMDLRILDLQADGFVPEDCDLLALLGPTEDYGPAEIRAIDDYLKRGGHLLVMLDPAQGSATMLPTLRELLRNWGIDVSVDMVYDSGSHSAEHNALVPLVGEFSPYHPITEDLQGRIGAIAMPIAAAVESTGELPENLFMVPFLMSSENSWTIDLAQYARMARTQVVVTPGQEERRAQPLAAALMAAQDAPVDVLTPRIAVFGDSDWLVNARLDNAALNLAYLTITWLTGRDELVSIPRAETEEVLLTLDRRQRMMISMFAVVVVPFTIFFGGLAYTTIRRRRR